METQERHLTSDSAIWSDAFSAWYGYVPPRRVHNNGIERTWRMGNDRKYSIID